MKHIRTRYAPSPTGFLHVGQIPTALFNYLFTKQNNGTFIVRIEDTDRERSKPEFEQAIFSDLAWLGIEPDESPAHGGNFGPYRQTERLVFYKNGLTTLLSEHKAFWCNHRSPETSNAVFWCPEDRETGGISGTGIIRFKNPYYALTDKKLSFQDKIRGNIEFDPALMGDFSIARNVESPLYNFAVVIDDHEMGVTDVIRGEDHVPNTPKQILLYEALGYETPTFAHLPIVLATDRTKLSKRKGALPIHEYQAQGYLPEAMINAMALIGWNPGDDREIFSKDELVREFSLEKVQTSGAIFDVTKLDWLNGEYIRKKSPTELLELCRPYLAPFVTDLDVPTEYLEAVIRLEQPRLKKLSEIGERIDYFFQEPEYDKELLSWKGAAEAETKASLAKSVELIQGHHDIFDSTSLQKTFFDAIGKGDKGQILWPLRATLSGKKFSPSPFEILEVLGKEQALSRLDRAIHMFL